MALVFGKIGAQEQHVLQYRTASLIRDLSLEIQADEKARSG